MTPSRVTADRSLYIAALSDAIDWQESFLGTHDPGWDSHGPTNGCCTPEARCDGYQKAATRLASYHRAYSHVTSQRRRMGIGNSQERRD
jgi:hypothetical protein